MPLLCNKKTHRKEPFNGITTYRKISRETTAPGGAPAQGCFEATSGGSWPPGREKEMMDYNPQNLEARLAEAGRALATELEADTAVSQAKANVEKAMQRLAEAQADKQSMPYPGNSSRYKLAQWHGLVAAEQSARVMLSESEKAYRSCLNDAAGARYAARLRAEENARQEKRDLKQSQHSAVEEEVARGLAEGRWLAAGGTKDSFATAWPTLWSKELERRVQAAEEQANRSAAARIRSAF